MNGVIGYVVRGKGAYASNSIFLPAAGYGDGSSLNGAGSRGEYWSSVPFFHGDYGANAILSTSDYHSASFDYRYRGLSVRPVHGLTN
jgi:hypothetical protein